MAARVSEVFTNCFLLLCRFLNKLVGSSEFLVRRQQAIILFSELNTSNSTLTLCDLKIIAIQPGRKSLPEFHQLLV